MPETEVQKPAEAEPSDEELVTRAEEVAERIENDAEGKRENIAERIQELDTRIQAIRTRIDETDKPRQAARLTDRLARILERRARIVERYDAKADKLDKKADKVEEKLEDITELRKKLEDLNKFIAANKDSNDPKVIREVAEKREQVVEVKNQLERKTRGEREQVLRAKQSELREQEALTRQEEQEAAERDLEKGLEEAEKGTEEESEDKDKEAPAKGKGETLDKKKTFNDRLKQTCSTLALSLANNPPDEDDTVGKTFFEAKRVLLMITSAIAGKPEWVVNLDEKQRKTIGLVVTTTEEDGETKYEVKWEKTDFSYKNTQDVFIKAFGDDWEDQMAKINKDTTFKSFKDSAEGNPEAQRLIAAMEKAGAKDDTKIMEFLNKKEDKVKEALEASAPETEASSPREEPKESPKDEGEDFLETLEALPNVSPEQLRAVMVGRVVSQLGGEEYNHSFDKNTLLIDAIQQLPGGSTSEAVDEMRRMFTTEPAIKESAIGFANLAESQGALSPEQVRSITQDAEDGQLETVNVDLLVEAGKTLIGKMEAAVQGVTLSQALAEYKPTNEQETAQLALARSRVDGTPAPTAGEAAQK